MSDSGTRNLGGRTSFTPLPQLALELDSLSLRQQNSIQSTQHDDLEDVESTSKPLGSIPAFVEREQRTEALTTQQTPHASTSFSPQPSSDRLRGSEKDRSDAGTLHNDGPIDPIADAVDEPPLSSQSHHLREPEEDRHEDGAEASRESAKNEAFDTQEALEEIEYDFVDFSALSEAESKEYRRLDFKPIQLNNWFLLTTLAFFLVCMAFIAALIHWDHKNHGVIDIHTAHNHLAFRYVPTAVGTVTTIWWRTIMTTLSRITPYISMAGKIDPSDKFNTNDRRNLRTLHNAYAYSVFTFSIWDLPGIAANGHWLLFGSALIQMILILFMVPLKATLLQVTPFHSGWNVTVSSPIGYTLIGIYGMLALFTLAVLIRLWNRDTGLRWDPVSIADQLALVQGSNVWGMFHGLEYATRKLFMDVLKKRAALFGALRLGYWRHRQNGSIRHGIGFILPRPEHNGRTKQASVQNVSQRQRQRQGQPNERQSHMDDSINTTNPAAEAIENGSGNPTTQRLMHPPVQNGSTLDWEGCPIHEPEMCRYRSVNTFLCDTSLAIYTLGTVVVVTLVILGLANHHLQRGIHFTPLSPSFSSSSDNTNTSLVLQDLVYDEEAGFVFRFLPVLVMNLFSLLWLSTDRFYRYTQPFAGMNGVTPASSNILLDYPSCMPIDITIKAMANGHWRVALFSLLSLASIAPPIIASGIFIGVWTGTEFNISIERANFWASFAILVIYLICIPLARPTTAYRLPREVWTIADLLCYCYASRVLDDKILDEPIFSVQEPTDGRVHLESKIHLAKKKYQFGFYLGKDGRRHLGFDVAERQNTSGQLESVIKVNPERAIYLGPSGWRWFFRRPQIEGMKV